MIVNKENMLTNSNSIKPKKIIKISNGKQPKKRQRLYSQYSPIIPMRCNTSTIEMHEQQKLTRNSAEKPSIKKQQIVQKRYSLARKNRNNHIQSDTNFDKLLEITSRCIKYYNNFINEKNTELMILENAFQQIEDHLTEAFKQLSSRILQKHRQLTQIVQSKYQQIISIKTSQQSELRKKLQQVKSIHLRNLLTDQTEQKHETQNNHIQNEQQLCFYAKTLNGFYEVIDQIQKISFKSKVDQEIQKLNQIISVQVKALTLKISGQQNKESQNMSFSFNENSSQKQVQRAVPSWWMCIKQKQAQRKKKINMYYEVLKS